MAISLIAYAKADIRAFWSAIEAIKAKAGNEKATKGIAAYHAQQAIEKIIKAEIYRANPSISPQKMYTHKIYDLCAIAESNGVKVPKVIKDKAYMYSDWEAAGRYDLHFSVRIDSVEKALRLAENWLREIEKAKKHPITFDEDCQELSPAMMKAFRSAVVQRNCKKKA